MIVAMAWRGCMQFRAGQQAPSQQRPCKLSPSFSSLAHVLFFSIVDATASHCVRPLFLPLVFAVEATTALREYRSSPTSSHPFVFLVFSSCQAGLVTALPQTRKTPSIFPPVLTHNSLEAADMIAARKQEMDITARATSI